MKSTTKLKMILASDLNGLIGLRNKNTGEYSQPFMLPKDLKRFKELTSQTPNTVSSVIMGRETFKAMGSKPLINRRNYILSKTFDPTTETVNYSKNWNNGHFGLFRSINEIIKYYAKCESLDRVFNFDLWIIGGASLYNQFEDIVDELYITVVDNYTEIPEDYEGIYFLHSLNGMVLKESYKTETDTDKVTGEELSFNTNIYTRVSY